MVIEVALGGEGITHLRKNRGHHFAYRGLTAATGDRHKTRGAGIAIGQGQLCQCVYRVRNPDLRKPQARVWLVYNSSHGSSLLGHSQIIVPVEVLTPKRHEHVSAGDSTRVGRDTVKLQAFQIAHCHSTAKPVDGIGQRE